MAVGGTWDDIFGAAPAALGDVALALRAQIIAIDPQNCETAYPSYKSMNYGVGPKKTTEGYAYLMLQADRINLGFYQGAALKDADGLLEGTGAALRHVKVRDVSLANDERVSDLITQAVDERRRTLAGKA